jgi:hypothetical protein
MRRSCGTGNIYELYLLLETQKWKSLRRNSEKKENRAFCWNTSFKIKVLSLFSIVHSCLYYFDSLGYAITTRILL